MNIYFVHNGVITGRNVSCVWPSQGRSPCLVFHRRPCQRPQGLVTVSWSVSLQLVTAEHNDVTESNSNTKHLISLMITRYSYQVSKNLAPEHGCPGLMFVFIIIFVSLSSCAGPGVKKTSIMYVIGYSPPATTYPANLASSWCGSAQWYPQRGGPSSYWAPPGAAPQTGCCCSSLEEVSANDKRQHVLDKWSTTCLKQEVHDGNNYSNTSPTQAAASH